MTTKTKKLKSAPASPDDNLTRMVLLADIDEPPLPMRAQMNRETLEILALDMRENGQLQAIGIEREGKRFKIVYGHRRYLAAQMNQWAEIEAKILDGTGAVNIKRMAAENFQREDVNDAEVGMWIHQLHHDEDMTLEQICAIVRRSPGWVDDRYALVIGDRAVFDAVMRGELGMGHAKVINRFTDPNYRTLHLEYATKHGVTVKYLEDSLRNFLMQNQPQTQTPAPVVTNGTTESAPLPVMACCFCGGSFDTWNLESVWIHKHELTQLRTLLERAQQGEVGVLPPDMSEALEVFRRYQAGELVEAVKA